VAKVVVEAVAVLIKDGRDRAMSQFNWGCTSVM
jgi:hypothetical protein